MTDEEKTDGIRLACCVYALGDTILYYNTNDKKMQVVESGFMPEFKKNPIVKSVDVRLDKPTLENPVDDEGNVRGFRA